MKFSVGDKVMLKRTGEEGHVVAITGKNMVEVDVKGTVFPAYTEELDHPYLKWFMEKSPMKKKTVLPEQLPVEKTPERKVRMARGVYLSFIPEFRAMDMEEMVTEMKIYLLNELPVNIRLAYEVRMGERLVFKHEGNLHAFGNMFLHTIPYADMNDQPRFHWLVTGPNNTVAEGVLRIKPVKLFAHVDAIQQGGAPSFEYLLAEELQERKKPEPVIAAPKVVAVPGGQPKPEAPKQELDLHIEKLRSNTKGLQNADIVKIQMDTLEHYLQLAIAHRQDKMIVIHGLGKGRLRDEVHAMLKTMPEVARFKNEWSGKYGFGATEVTFRY
jgi:hypothetical protein